MCGRYVSLSSPDRLALHFDVAEVAAEPLGERYNVAPTLDVYAVVDAGGRRRLGTLRWGLVPHWARSLREGPSPINARIETVLDKKLFAPLFTHRRCLIPADGFYEWRRDATGGRVPYFFSDPSDAPLAFAGLWSMWRGADGEAVATTAVLTTAANASVRDVHDRMPVVLPRSWWDDWLTVAADQAPALREAVAALDGPSLDRRQVSPQVNNVRNDGPELLASANH